MAAANMQPIYDRLNAVAGYNPLTAETFGDWAMEAGDIVRVIRGEDAYDVPVHSSTLIWRGQQRMNIDATGKKERDSIAKASAQKYGRGGAAVRGSQSMYQYFESENQSLRSEFEMSYESLRVTFENELDSTRSEFQMTAESLRIQFENELSSTRSEFEMTSESLRIQFENELSSTRSEFEATSESLRITFESEISSTRADLQVQANRIGLVVQGTGANARIKAAEIAVAINDENSEAFINADHVYISGTTKLSGQLTVQDGSLLVKTALLVSGSTGGNVTINNGKITAKEYQVNSGGGIVFVGAGTGEHYDLSASTLQGMIKSFSVTGNILTLTPFYGDPVDFSKATTLTGAVGSGADGSKYIVTASPQGTQHQVTVSQEIDGAVVPNETVFAKTYVVSSSVARTQIGNAVEMTLSEDVNNKTVNLTTMSGAITKGSISTADTWQAGFNSAESHYSAINGYEELSAGGAIYYAGGTPENYYKETDSGGTVYYRAGTPANYYKELSSGGAQWFAAGTPANYYPEVASGGTVYYTAGTAETYYKSVSSGGTVYYTAESPANYYKELSSGGAVWYAAGTPTTYYNQGTTTKYARGGTVDVYPVGNTTYYYIRHAKTDTPTTAWYERTTTKPAAGTTYDERYEKGSKVTYYKGDGGSFTVQGTSTTTVTPINTDSYIRVDSRASVTPISSTSIRVNTAASVTPISSTSIRVGARAIVTPINADSSIRVDSRASVTPISNSSIRVEARAIVTPINVDNSIRVNSRSILYKKS